MASSKPCNIRSGSTFFLLFLSLLFQGVLHAQLQVHSSGKNPNAFRNVTDVPKEAPTVGGTIEFAYVVNQGSGNVSAYIVDSSTGVLSQVSGSPFPAGNAPHSIAIDPLGRFGYVANGGSNDISGYAIDRKTGALTPIAGSPFAGEGGPQSVAVNPRGGFAYVSNFFTNSVSVYAADPANGSLKEIVGSPFAAGTQPVSVTLDSTGQFVYVANLLSNDISAYAVQTDGSLVPIAGSPFAAGLEPNSVTVDSLNRFLYAANDGGNVSAYAIDSATGALTQITGSPFPVGDWSSSVAVDPSARFAYVGGGNDGTFTTPGYVAGFSIDANTGALAPVPGSPFAAGTAPWSIAVDPSARFVYAANLFITSSSLSAYTVNSDSGELTPIPGSPFATGENPVSVTVVRIGLAKTSTALTSTLNPSTYGQKVTWTATVTTAGSIMPTGEVKFTWSIYTIGSATLNSSGVATLSKSNLNADTFPLTAVYLGDANNLGSTSAVLNQVVLQTTSVASLTSSPNPSTQGEAVTFTAAISSPTVVPKGPVTFTAGKTVLGTAQLSGGKARLTISTLSAGSTKVTATYNGDSNIAKSSASVVQIVQ